MTTSPFTYPSFLRFWIGRLAGTLANQMLMVAVGWQMYDLTHQAWDLGLVGLFQFVPALALLHAGPTGLGVLRGAPAIGALAMSLVLARWSIDRGVGKLLFASVAVFGAATVAFGLSRSMPLSIVALGVTGAADMISVVVRQTLVQLETPDEMRGRVSAVNSIFIGASNQLGEFESGALAALLGPVGAVVLGGAGTMAVVVLWMRWFPQLRRRDRLATAS